jgi:hypothetical protein
LNPNGRIEKFIQIALLVHGTFLLPEAISIASEI